MSDSPLITVVTPTTGTNYLKENILSIQKQTYPFVQHLIVVDGKEHLQKVIAIFDELQKTNKLKGIDVIPLPYATGTERFNGHRIYGASNYLCSGDYISYLDEDNFVDPQHIEVMLNTITKNNVVWSNTLRKIVDTDGTFVCNDDCESLGKYPSVLHEEDYFVDMNCYLLPKPVALDLSPLYYRKAREPGVMEIDRILTAVLRQNNIAFECTNNYTVNYRAGNSAISVKKEFFLNGNTKMLEKYENNLPWRTENEV